MKWVKFDFSISIQGTGIVEFFDNRIKYGAQIWIHQFLHLSGRFFLIWDLAT